MPWLIAALASLTAIVSLVLCWAFLQSSKDTIQMLRDQLSLEASRVTDLMNRVQSSSWQVYQQTVPGLISDLQVFLPDDDEDDLEGTILVDQTDTLRE